ncbi:hypothetical protein FDB24_10460 [Clostridium botulinum]|uniref:hypothetical protein n=1 Tax=Clostridium botulinum TaxID=1491 RepID=UPI000772E04C|nr:hypothetical protein [Clostridium botulinum]NFL87346.1 hypothetical protein [Clostridium botulinum]NFO21683.1 hypothetical protein [Clostridium botulinum]
MITCIIDKDGYIVNPCIEKKKISEEDICVHVLNDYSLIKPKWNFEKEKWTEGATQEEIKEYEEEKNKSVEKEPTENEVLMSNIILENAQLKTGLQEQQELTANLLLKIAELKGGNENV